jgi:hypothetical protein
MPQNPLPAASSQVRVTLNSRPFGIKHNMDIIMTKSDWNCRGLAAECYDLWFGNEPFRDQAFFHDRIHRNDGVALEIACGTGRLLVSFRRDGLVVANVASLLDIVRTEAEHVAAAGDDKWRDD